MNKVTDDYTRANQRISCEMGKSYFLPTSLYRTLITVYVMGRGSRVGGRNIYFRLGFSTYFILILPEAQVAVVILKVEN